MAHKYNKKWKQAKPSFKLNITALDHLNSPVKKKKQ